MSDDRSADAWHDFTQRCQKPDHTRVGNWYARRVSRPAALRITWLVLPSGVSAHTMTLAAWVCGLAAAGSLAWGTAGAWLVGAALLQLWYLLDHVDGQVARYRGRATLDGVALDYLMHHTLNMLVPLGLGHGVAAWSEDPSWCLAGTAWALGALLLGLEHDVRGKAFLQRLKRLRGELRVLGGGGGRPGPAPPPPRGRVRRLGWLAHKACEPHVVMNALAVLALAQWLLAAGLLAGAAYVALMAAIAPLLAAARLVRSLREEAAEKEFAAWFRPDEGHVLLQRDGWWHVCGPADTAITSARLDPAGPPRLE